MSKDEIRALLILAIFYLLIGFSAKAQEEPDDYTPIQEVDDILINRYVVYHGQTIDLTNLGGNALEVGDSIIYVSHTYLANILAQAQYNAVTLGDSAIAKGFSISPEQELEFDYSQFVFTDLLGTSEYSTAWENSDSLVTQKQAYAEIEKVKSEQDNVKKVTLPAASSVYNRIQGAIEGIDYPEGWVLSDMVDGNYHISIQHNRGQRIAGLSICSVSGDEERELRPYSTAYMGYYSPDNNTLVIETLCQAPVKVAIYITFE